MIIAKGCGYWNTTRYPYGGDFRRSDGTVEVVEVLERGIGKSGEESRVKLVNGDTAVVTTDSLLMGEPKLGGTKP